MRFVRFSLEWASSGAYKFTEDAPFFPIKSTAETSINDVLGTESSTDEAVYDLSGRRIASPTKSGIYIQNSKKIFIDR